MDVVLTLVMNGLANSALFFLMAAGLSLIFGLLRVINFAHGAFYIWGAYIASFLYEATGSFLLAMAGGVLTGAALGWLTERLLLHRLYGAQTQQLLMTMGVLMVLTELIKLPFGRNPVNSSAPRVLTHSWLFGHFALIEFQVLTIFAGIAVYILLQILLRKSRLGMIVRAGVQNSELVQARGIPIHTIFTTVFTFGAALAGLAGVLAGPYFGSISPEAGMSMQLNAFIIVVLGGLGSLNGSVVGSVFVGLATAVTSYFAPALAVLAGVVVMAAVLVVRPEGLFGEKGGVL
ncbi:branched-chain amino acid ABC transporter permease [Alicyclobacillus sp. SO9]|uniref:branched-chain amino acid ABC transporter permease n=1 Tax=Alicyclobacillus sp. SO9 TaxID=2665646 RepID=UPI0018E70564|nr:branched-chain amino acid ABC transporter permease [Alicyclobacillus sp. SO9]QQE77516.1 branched-chain amino acid ABC transporter permease [Alicyclobacillus sp. SO9]